MFSVTLLLYNLLFPVLFALYFPFYLIHLVKRGNWRRGFLEKLGWYGREKRAQLAQLARPVWVHAVSVGETVAALGFIRAWREREPAQAFVLSTTSSTGQQLARDKAPAGVVTIYFPLDWLPCVGLALRAVRPSQLLLVEGEIWPTVIWVATRRGVPVSVINGQISDRAAVGYRRHRWLFAPLFRRLRVFAVQAADDAERVRAVMGPAAGLVVCGSMKFDQVPDRDRGDVSDLLARVFPSERLVFCAASTHAPEEAIVARVTRQLQAQVPGLRTILVPRHHERTAEVEAVLRAAGANYVLLTDLRASPEPRPADLLVVNTTGELMNFLAASDFTFVGKSLGDFGGDGGHNIIEPAIFGKPIIVGPAVENFRDIVQVFRDRQAVIQVADEAKFARELTRLATDAEARARLGAAARRTVEEQRGAIAKTIALVAGR